MENGDVNQSLFEMRHAFFSYRYPYLYEHLTCEIACDVPKKSQYFALLGEFRCQLTDPGGRLGWPGQAV